MLKLLIIPILIVGFVYCEAQFKDPIATLIRSIKVIPPLYNVAEIEGITKDCLEYHNQYRKKHGAEPLVYDDEIEKFAIGRANLIADIDIRRHIDLNNPYGENLYTFYSNEKESEINFCQRAVDSWYNETQFYSYDYSGYGRKTYHFTALVWKSTTKLGCAKSKTWATGNYHVVCDYSEPGNIKGQYKENVLPPQ